MEESATPTTTGTCCEVSFNHAQRFSQAQCHAKVLAGEPDEEEILDSGSTVSLMKGKDKVVDIQKQKINVLMSTNAGSKVVDKEATRKGYGKVLYDPEAMTNLRSLSEMVRRGYRVQMDTDLENAFLATSPNGEQIKFLCDDRGLYVLEQVNQIKGFT